MEMDREMNPALGLVSNRRGGHGPKVSFDRPFRRGNTVARRCRKRGSNAVRRWRRGNNLFIGRGGGSAGGARPLPPGGGWGAVPPGPGRPTGKRARRGGVTARRGRGAP